MREGRAMRTISSDELRLLLTITGIICLSVLMGAFPTIWNSLGN